MEPANSWGRGEGWPRVMALLELGRKPDGSEWTAERKERLFQRVLAREAKERERRRVVRAFAAGASTVLVVGLLLKLISGGIAPQDPTKVGVIATPQDPTKVGVIVATRSAAR